MYSRASPVSVRDRVGVEATNPDIDVEVLIGI
jgi:hypothetical protein